MKYIIALIALVATLTATAHSQGIYVFNGSALSCGIVTTANYKGAFQANSFSLGGAEPMTNPGTPLAAAKVTLSNLVITKAIDNCSSALMTEFLTGQTIPTLKLVEVQLVGSTSIPLLTITLSSVQINSYNLQDSNNNKGTEQIAFKFERIEIVSTPVSASGTPGTPVTITWDIPTNTVQ